MKRRQFIQQSSLATAALLFNQFSFAGTSGDFPVVRPPLAERKFTSKAVEATIAAVSGNIRNKELGWLFGNCFPNTLDTTVDFTIINGKPDTYVITGDIDAMWLRDSTAQVWPYLPLMQQDEALKQLIQGVINRQTNCILKDPYANAFYKDETRVSEWKERDITDMKPGIHERKWEIDSLCYPIRLAYGYWKTTGDASLFDANWIAAMRKVVKTFKEQQRKDDKGPYSFQRNTSWATDGVPLGGYGYPVKYTGLICSMFRPSDDATVFPYLIPSNFFAAVSLRQLREILGNTNADGVLLKAVITMETTVRKALEAHASVQQPGGKIYAFEVNGYGSHHLMDDANVPSLLSLPYLGAVPINDPIYQNTRRYVLSTENPFYFYGKAGEGIGGPHVGIDMIWPLSIIMRGLTSTNDEELKNCLKILQGSHAGTGFMHEAFHKNDAANFTRKWFAWANTLFGELIWKVYRERPGLLNGR
jgi:uncharacterized protein